MLTSRYNELREKMATLREQITYRQSSIADMEQALVQAEQKLVSFHDEVQFFTGRDGAGELTAEDIEIRIGQAVSEKERIEQAIGTGRDSRVVLAGHLDEGELQLRQTPGGDRGSDCRAEYSDRSNFTA